MRRYSFVIVDVFTDRPLSGNPLAVFPDADGLSDVWMQAIAREFRFSETTFVVTPNRRQATRRLRCFSPTAEVFGAGHNALGAWWVLLATGRVAIPADGTLWQELGEDVLPVVVELDDETVRRVAMKQIMPTLARADVSLTGLAAALGLAPEAIHPTLKSAVSSAGATRHLLVPLTGRTQLSRIVVDRPALASLAHVVGCEGCYAFSTDGADGNAVASARGFFPGIGIDEDPATGSAAGPLGMYLVQLGQASAGRWLTISQGADMGRPSRVEV